ncbi:hypothetical protein T02_15010 [Trichinella nativa]|uniref:Uncharacterized protein n=1 Tax=Trichinella nativa TaxID=6335 RepID=A0A0V1LI47_9BILA|nr:hypothetical protein T02_15010 [Trichinella nativa]
MQELTFLYTWPRFVCVLMRMQCMQAQFKPQLISAEVRLTTTKNENREMQNILWKWTQMSSKNKACPMNDGEELFYDVVINLKNQKQLMTPQNFRYKKVLLNTTNVATVCQQMQKTSVNNNIKEKKSQFVRRGEKQCEDLQLALSTSKQSRDYVFRALSISILISRNE